MDIPRIRTEDYLHTKWEKVPEDSASFKRMHASCSFRR